MRGFTQTSPHRAITIMFPNPIDATLPQTKHATNYPRNPNAPTPLRTRTQPRCPTPSGKKRRHTPAHIPAIYNIVSVNLAPSLRTHKRTKQITNRNQPALFGYFFHHHTTSTTAIPNQIFHKKESPRHNGGDAVLLSP